MEYTQEQEYNSKMTGIPLMSREEARHTDNHLFFTGLPCSRGHIAERRTVSARCVECVKEDNVNPVKEDAQTRLDELQQGMSASKIAVAEEMLKADTLYEAVLSAFPDLGPKATEQLIDDISYDPLFRKYVDLLRKVNYDPVTEVDQLAATTLKNMVTAKITDVLSWREETVMIAGGQEIKELKFELKDSDIIPTEAMESIKEVTMTKYGPKVVMYDKLAAIQALHKITHQNEDINKILDKDEKDITPEEVKKIKDIWNGKSI